MSSFFADVKPELQIAFAQMHGITQAQLVAAAKTFAAYSGQSYPRRIRPTRPNSLRVKAG
jgi:hypothetical protein